MATDTDWEDLALKAGQAFSPGAPINERDLFRGRQEQIRRVVDAVNQKGQHAAIFGERGVGKTSLSRVIRQFLSGYPEVITPSITCESSDTFESVWRKVFSRIDIAKPGAPTLGFSNAGRQTDMFKLSDVVSGPITADVVRDQLEQVAVRALPIIIIDEFDRLKADASIGFADTIKTLSDHAVDATVLLVGVGDSIDQLMEDHRSVGRVLKQIQMPRMAPNEVAEILTTGLKKLGMTITADARERVVLLARGLPHYAHLIGLHASRAALDAHSLQIGVSAVNRGIERATEDAEQTTRTAYRIATQSNKKRTLFSDVLLACAVAACDEHGYFTAGAVRDALQRITGRNLEIPNFAKHLADFSDAKRGHVLVREGDGRYKYRFADPLLQPYVIMHGLQNSHIAAAVLELNPHYATAL